MLINANLVSAFPAHAVIRRKLDTGFFKGLLDCRARKFMRRAQLVLKTMNGFVRHADLFGELLLRPVQQAARGAALSRRNIHAPTVMTDLRETQPSGPQIAIYL